jgi:hypothetical protein
LRFDFGIGPFVIQDARSPSGWEHQSSTVR